MPKQKGLDDPKALWNQNPRDAVAPIQYVIGACSGMVTPILHSGFGSRGQMTQVFSLPLIWFLAVEERAPPLILYLGLWLAFVAYRAMTRDRYEHSQFGGYPWLAMMIPFMNDYYRALAIEPWLLFGFACWVYQWHQGTSMLFFIGAIALFFEWVIFNGSRNKRMRMLRDAEIEAGHWQELQRRGR